MTDPFDLHDHVVLEIEGLQVHVFLESTDLLDHLVVQIDLLVHLCELVQALHLANRPQVLLSHQQRSRLGPLQVSRPPGNPQLPRNQGLLGYFQA